MTCERMRLSVSSLVPCETDWGSVWTQKRVDLPAAALLGLRGGLRALDTAFGLALLPPLLALVLALAEAVLGFVLLRAPTPPVSGTGGVIAPGHCCSDRLSIRPLSTIPAEDGGGNHAAEATSAGGLDRKGSACDS